MSKEKRAGPVYVVDDDEAVRDSLRILLELNGFTVEDFETTDAFAAHYRNPHTGCLILDQHLPMKTGMDFLMSTSAAALGIPVILITGRGDAALRKLAFRAGAAAYLEKPVSEDLLLSTVNRLLEKQR